MNYRCKAGEIDLVAKADDVIAFVEVKTRRNLRYGHPIEAVTALKMEHIKRVASWYIEKEGPYDKNTEFRFDVVEVLLMNDKTYVNHVKNAFF